jgi:hypothetical protein
MFFRGKRNASSPRPGSCVGSSSGYKNLTHLDHSDILYSHSMRNDAESIMRSISDMYRSRVSAVHEVCTKFSGRALVYSIYSVEGLMPAPELLQPAEQ